MHTPCMPKLVRKTYMQLGTYNRNLLQMLIPMSSCTFPLFLCLLAPNHQVSILSKSAPTKNEVSKSMRERERERIMRELQKFTDKRYQLILKSLFIEDASIFFILHYFHLLIATCDLSPPFSPNFLYFHEYMCQICYFSFPKPQPLPLPISVAIINQMNTHQDVFSHHSTWNTCPNHRGLIYFT